MGMTVDTDELIPSIKIQCILCFFFKVWPPCFHLAKEENKTKLTSSSKQQHKKNTHNPPIYPQLSSLLFSHGPLLPQSLTHFVYEYIRFLTVYLGDTSCEEKRSRELRQWLIAAAPHNTVLTEAAGHTRDSITTPTSRHGPQCALRHRSTLCDARRELTVKPCAGTV